jgi:hypothetical protein
MYLFSERQLNADLLKVLLSRKIPPRTIRTKQEKDKGGCFHLAKKGQTP